MILAYDIGTTTLKIALIDRNGKFHNYKNQKLMNNIKGKKAECNSQTYLSFLSSYLKEIDTSLIRAIAVSSNGPSLVPVLGEPSVDNSQIKIRAYPTRLWLDKRGQEKSSLVSEYYGCYIDGSFPLPTILAIKENENEIYNSSKLFLTVDGFVDYALTGKPVVVNSPKGLLKYYWNDETLKHFDLDQSKFPKIIKSGLTLSKISSSIAEEFKIDKSTKVITGGTDFFVNILGSFAKDEGTLCDRSGTSEGLNLCSKKEINIPSLMCYEHPIEKFWNISGVISTTGAAIDWIREVLNLKNESYNYFFQLASKASAESDLLFLPYLNGERAPIWNSEAKGVMFGLTLDSKKEEISKAVLEGTCLALKDVIKTMEENGATVNQINIANSHHLNNFYLQLKGDITGKQINIIDTPSPELLGLSILSYTNLKVFESYKAAIEAMTKIDRVYKPKKENSEKYEKLYVRYKHLYKVLKKEF